jgi:hypothetical protein
MSFLKSFEFCTYLKKITEIAASSVEVVELSSSKEHIVETFIHLLDESYNTSDIDQFLFCVKSLSSTEEFHKYLVIGVTGILQSKINPGRNRDSIATALVNAFTPEEFALMHMQCILHLFKLINRMTGGN